MNIHNPKYPPQAELMEENRTLHRDIASYKLLAQQAGDRLDAKNRECNALREEIAKLNERLGRK
jgi:hypothetical protein